MWLKYSPEFRAQAKISRKWLYLWRERVRATEDAQTLEDREKERLRKRVAVPRREPSTAAHLARHLADHGKAPRNLPARAVVLKRQAVHRFPRRGAAE
jgi:hypothetical protein